MKNEKSVNQDLELANLGDVDVQIKLEPTPSDLSNDSDLRLINKARGVLFSHAKISEILLRILRCLFYRQY